MILLATVFVVAACGLVYELVAGAISSYLRGDAVTQFSLVIGVFLSSMGAGSYLAQFIRKHLLRRFVSIEIWLGVVGGTSSMSVFAFSAFFDPWFPVFFYGLCAVLGLLIGAEIPILVRILSGDDPDADTTGVLSNVLALDYLGALAGTILFPLLALPVLGLARASVVFGLMNLAVAWAAMSLVPGRKRWLVGGWAAAMVVLLGSLAYSVKAVHFIEDLLYQDEVVYTEDTPYQRIVITRWRDDVRLFLNGHIQFSSVDEARYHEPLVIPAMEAAAPVQSVLILGGGDGLATREVLKYPSVKSVTLVDLDPVMTKIASTRTDLVDLNQGSLGDSRVRVVNQDAMTFVEGDRDFYDAIFVDLPDPSSDNLSRLYSRAFYALLARRLSAQGVMVTQATSPFYAPEAFWCIVRTMEAAFPDAAPDEMHAYPYHVLVPSFGEWGFVMASREPIEPLRLTPRVKTKYLNPGALSAMFAFGNDNLRIDGPVNTLEAPLLFNLYKKGWRDFN
ncbi:MAG: polyamine aminopropyltransferase [Deltaproteobacteria bacterium]|nr:polyamine aminopropyltransferase [Deltaproteobacteria bacterium]